MTDQQHLITPPPELVQQWTEEWIEQSITNKRWGCDHVAIKAARWGADMELEACCEFENKYYGEDYAAKLRRYRRPRPKSLAEKSLDLIDKIQSNKKMWQIEELDVVRRALERLQELEGQGQLTKESD